MGEENREDGWRLSSRFGILRGWLEECGVPHNVGVGKEGLRFGFGMESWDALEGGGGRGGA